MTIHPVPKPEPTAKPARKRLQSKTRPTRKTPIKKVNRARLDKRTKDYRDYIKSPEWKARRAACLARDKYTCQVCGYSKAPGLSRVSDILDDRQLHAAHLTYAHFKQEPLEDLVTKCGPCHLNREHAGRFIRPRGLRGGR